MIRPPVDLSVVLVNWNTAALTLRALASVPEAAGPLVVERICVDNGSRDGSVARVRARHPEVRILENAANQGFARAANRALPLLSGRYTCFLNSDARPRRGALAHLVHWLDAHPAAVIAAPRLVDAADRPGVVGRPEPMPFALLHESTILGAGRIGRRGAYAWRAGLALEESCQVPNLVGACLVIRTDWMRALGGYDEGYFFYWEDTDLCRAVRRRGGEVWMVSGGPPVEHVGGASTPRGSALHRVCFLAGLVRYMRKDLSPSRGDAFAAVAVLGFWLRAWQKGLGLPWRSAARRLRGRPADAARAMVDARAWLAVLERQGRALLGILRRPPAAPRGPA